MRNKKIKKDIYRLNLGLIGLNIKRIKILVQIIPKNDTNKHPK